MLKELTEQHRAVARLLEQGVTHREIAQATGFTQRTVEKLARDPKIRALAGREVDQQVIQRTNVQKAQDTLHLSAKAAASLLHSIVTEEEVMGRIPTVKDRIEAANSILDRTGHSKTVNVNNAHVHVFNADDLTEIKRRASLQKLGRVEAELLEEATC